MVRPRELPDRGHLASVNLLLRNHLVAAARVFQAMLEAEGKAWSRKLLDEQEFAGYRDAWDLIDLPAANVVEWRMPDWVTDGLHEYPQPDLDVPIDRSGKPALFAKRRPSCHAELVGKKLLAVIDPGKPISEMTEEELDRLADFIAAKTRAALRDGRDASADNGRRLGVDSGSGHASAPAE